MPILRLLQNNAAKNHSRCDDNHWVSHSSFLGGKCQSTTPVSQCLGREVLSVKGSTAQGNDCLRGRWDLTRRTSVCLCQQDGEAVGGGVWGAWQHLIPAGARAAAFSLIPAVRPAPLPSHLCPSQNLTLQLDPAQFSLQSTSFVHSFTLFIHIICTKVIGAHHWS